MASTESPVIPSMRASLTREGDRVFRAPAWLTESHNQPELFWRRYLEPIVQFGGGRSRSKLHEGYDLYHDIVARHLGHNRLAWSFVTRTGEIAELTFEQIHQRCRCLSEQWRNMGTEAGMSVAIILPFGLDYILTVLTALRMGLIVTPITPQGRRFAAERLQVLEPDWLVSTDSYAKWIKASTPRLAETVKPVSLAGVADRSHYYDANGLVARLFSPLSIDLLTPVDLNAEQLFLGLARDGALCLGLSPGSVLAAPGFCTEQFQPTLTLAAFFVGAAYFEVEAQEIDINPSLIASSHVTHLGLTDRVRDLLLSEGDKPLGRFTHWFRNPAVTMDWPAWTRFCKKAEREQKLGFTYFANAAAAGCIFTGAPGRQPRLTHVLPVPAERFSLADTNLSGMAAVGQAGVFEWLSLDNPESAVGRMLVSRDRHEYFLVGALQHNREGQVFPTTAIEALGRNEDHVADACVVLHPGADSTWRAILMLFVEPGRLQAKQTRELIEHVKVLCEAEQGLKSIPDQVEVFELSPRYKNDELDRSWCRSQYLSGMLHRKSQTRCFTELAQLRYTLERITAAPTRSLET